MGTRGAYGYIKDGKPKVTYNHFDSCPEGLGNDILAYCKKYSPEQMAKHFDAIKLVKEGTKPTKAQQKRVLSKFANFSVGSQSPTDWYCMLRDCQGDLEKHVMAGFMIDSYDFMKDSLFCEWAYLINLDSGELEIYKGLNEKRPKGRFALSAPKDGYYPVTLVASFPLRELPEELNGLEASEED